MAEKNKRRLSLTLSSQLINCDNLLPKAQSCKIHHLDRDTAIYAGENCGNVRSLSLSVLPAYSYFHRNCTESTDEKDINAKPGNYPNSLGVSGVWNPQAKAPIANTNQEAFERLHI
jgi:hypothetical protein